MSTAGVATEDPALGVRRLTRLGEVFQGFGADPRENIRRLVAALGEALEADGAFYNRAEDGALHEGVAWHARPASHGLALRTTIGRPVMFGGTCLGSLSIGYRGDAALGPSGDALLGTVAAAIGVEESRGRVDQQYRVLFEDSLRSLSLLEATLESTADGLLVIDDRQHVVCCNEKFITLWQLPRELVSSRDDARLIEFVSGQLKDPQEFVRRVGALYANPELESCDMLEFADGRVFERLSQPQRVRGNVVGRVFSFRDVTARTRAEEANRRLAAVVEQSGEFVVVIDPSGAIDYANPAFTRIAGWSRDEAAGSMFVVLAATESDAGVLGQLWTEACRSGLSSGSIGLRRQDGGTLEAALTLSVVRDAGGQLANVVAIGRDVTAERRLEDQLRQTQKMEAVGQLAGGVAHDFNNLLTAIGGYAELAIDHVGAQDPLKLLLGEISKAAGRASSLTAQLLALSRRQVLQPKHVDLARAIGTLEPMLRSVIGEQIAIETNVGPGDHVVRVDPDQFEQVVLNLVVNARDAMPRGGRLTLGVSNARITAGGLAEGPQQPGEYVVLTVADNGCGMDRTTLARIFEPFFTTKERGKGTGLGLSSVYGIVSQSNGTINVESAPGAGTTFRVHLPRVTRDADTPERTAEVPAWRGSGTVLLVEDEEQVRTLVASFLQRCGFLVLAAATPAEALAIEERYPGSIDLLLTDVVMPGASGPELARAIAARRTQLAIVFISGYDDHALGEVGSGTFFLRKPFALEALGRTVRAALGEVLTGPVL